MPDWNSIFKEEGRVFCRPHEGMRRFISLLKKGGARRVLDLGCGTGRHTVMLAKAGFAVCGMDNSEEALRQTRVWLRQEGLKARLVNASCHERFPFRDGNFDAVVSVQVIHHAKIDRVRLCIREIFRVLKAGGIGFITLSRDDQKGRPIAPRTYEKLEGRESGLVHYVYNQRLLREDFRAFRILGLRLDRRRHNTILVQKPL